MYDVKISNGTIVDGTGAPRFVGHVAVKDGVVVGCALGGPQANEPPYQGELYVLNILPAYQRQGIGRRLVARTAERLAAAAITSMLVRVLSVNPNRAFYERLGARFIREEPYDWNDVILAASVYGWPSTAALIGEIQRNAPG